MAISGPQEILVGAGLVPVREDSPRRQTDQGNRPNNSGPMTRPQLTLLTHCSMENLVACHNSGGKPGMSIDYHVGGVRRGRVIGPDLFG